MSVEQHPEPITEGLVHSGQRMVQVVALATAVQQGYARRVERLRAASEAREAEAEQAAALELKASFEQARARWAPAHDSRWLRKANLLFVAEAWGAAVPYATDSASAASAVRKCEDRLRDLHPHGMSHYDRARGAGQDPLIAMGEAAPFFARDPNVRTGDPAAARPELPKGTGVRWAANFHGPDRSEWEEVLQEQRAQGIADGLGTERRREGRELHPDELRTVLTTTTNLPEHIIAKVAGAADGTAEARLGSFTPMELAAEDFPLSIDDAMAVTAARAGGTPEAKRATSQTPDRNRRRNR
ncbi:hypothetical protein [Actinomadura sp. 9N407]|uniref:hypothetical protein n=1 Tax=Actinomadura sp. 9N407 TaxID=3375154 RepID=UPI0037A6E948